MLRRTGVVVVAVVLWTGLAGAQEAEQKSPPLPCINIEGSGGIFITETAYLEHPWKGKDWAGLPAVGFSFASIGKKTFESFEVTWTVWQRVELGFAHERLDVGDWRKDVYNATGLNTKDDVVKMDTFSVRGLIIPESQYVPAVTLGVHYKHNEDIMDFNDNLMGAVKYLGVERADGWEGTLMVSKTFTGILPKPFILSAGIRNTDAAQTGLLGFTGDRETVFEANAVFFITDRLLLAGEYRQKPDQLKRIQGLVGREDDWWTVCLGYILTDHAVVAVGYGNFGNVLNHEEDSVWAAHIKYEF